MKTASTFAILVLCILDENLTSVCSSDYSKKINRFPFPDVPGEPSPQCGARPVHVLVWCVLGSFGNSSSPVACLSVTDMQALLNPDTSRILRFF